MFDKNGDSPFADFDLEKYLQDPDYPKGSPKALGQTYDLEFRNFTPELLEDLRHEVAEYVDNSWEAVETLIDFNLATAAPESDPMVERLERSLSMTAEVLCASIMRSVHGEVAGTLVSQVFLKVQVMNAVLERMIYHQ